MFYRLADIEARCTAGVVAVRVWRRLRVHAAEAVHLVCHSSGTIIIVNNQCHPHTTWGGDAYRPLAA
jgi:hypothetical protein